MVPVRSAKYISVSLLSNIHVSWLYRSKASGYNWRLITKYLIVLLKRRDDNNTDADSQAEAQGGLLRDEGRSRLRSGTMEARCRFLPESANRRPANLSIWLKYGDACKEMGDLGEAESAYRAVVARDTSSPEPCLHLGHILKMQGRQQEAEAAYLQFIGLRTSNPEAISGLESLGWSQRQLTALRHIAEPAGGTQRE